jgi:hypothetical protein
VVLAGAPLLAGLSAGAAVVCAKLKAHTTTTANTTVSSFFINLSPFATFSILFFFQSAKNNDRLNGKALYPNRVPVSKKNHPRVRFLAAAARAGAWWKESHAGSGKLNRLPFPVPRFQRNELLLRETGDGKRETVYAAFLPEHRVENFN